VDLSNRPSAAPGRVLPLSNRAGVIVARFSPDHDDLGSASVFNAHTAIPPLNVHPQHSRCQSLFASSVYSRGGPNDGTGQGAPGERNYIDYCIDYNLANVPLPKPLEADDVGRWALALCSDLGGSVTGTCQYVDNGMHAMGLTVDSNSFKVPATLLPAPSLLSQPPPHSFLKDGTVPAAEAGKW
jgi:hypothetical protein